MSNTLKQFYLSVFDHFVGLALKGLRFMSSFGSSYNNQLINKYKPWKYFKKNSLVKRSVTKEIFAKLPQYHHGYVAPSHELYCQRLSSVKNKIVSIPLIFILDISAKNYLNDCFPYQPYCDILSFRNLFDEVIFDTI